MRYLFFDTESSNCFGGIYKVCEWGSLITDEALTKIKAWLEQGFFLKRNLNVPYLVCYDEAEREKLAAHLDLTKLKLVSIDEFGELTKA